MTSVTVLSTVTKTSSSKKVIGETYLNRVILSRIFTLFM